MYGFPFGSPPWRCASRRSFVSVSVHQCCKPGLKRIIGDMPNIGSPINFIISSSILLFSALTYSFLTSGPLGDKLEAPVVEDDSSFNISTRLVTGSSRSSTSKACIQTKMQKFVLIKYLINFRQGEYAQIQMLSGGCQYEDSI